MITKTGLVSITFRQLAPAELVSLVAQAQLDGIEWGGDVHVPHGDVAQARAVRQLTHDAGLHVLAYGSYFRLRKGEAFEPVLETAVALGARLIRVWAGDLGSALADDATRERINVESRRISELAEREDIHVAYEFHGNTLTDTLESTLQLLDAAPLMQTLWQPQHELPEAAQLEGLLAVLQRLANVHVFHWHGPERTRLPIREGKTAWQKRLSIVANDAQPHAALIEFVTNDDPAAFLLDAASLREWVVELSETGL